VHDNHQNFQIHFFLFKLGCANFGAIVRCRSIKTPPIIFDFSIINYKKSQSED